MIVRVLAVVGLGLASVATLTSPADAALCGGAVYMDKVLTPHQTNFVVYSTTATFYTATFFQLDSMQAVPTIAALGTGVAAGDPAEQWLGVYNDTSGNLEADGYMRVIKSC